MHTFIRCCSCGNNIGAFYEAYTTILHERLGDKIKDMIGQLKIEFEPLTDSIQVSMSDIFDAMFLDRYCCRMRLISTAVITDIKKGY